MGRMDEKIEEDVKKQCAKYYPLQNILVTKVKVLKKPRFDAAKMNEFYGEKSAFAAEILSQGAAADTKSEEPKNLLAQGAKK